MSVTANYNNSIDVALPNTPELTNDPKVFDELMLLYRAVKNLQAVCSGLLASQGSNISSQGSNISALQNYYIPINNTGAVADISLGVGQSAYINMTGGSSTPLHIATGDGQMYELSLFSTAVANATAVNLQPNNTAYGAVYTYRELYGASATASAGASSGYSYFTLEIAGGAFGTFTRISTSTLFKGGISISSGTSSTVSYVGVVGIQWNDTTTVWSSLGTIQFGHAWTGKVLIKRVL